jgi:hypothetical protein
MVEDLGSADIGAHPLGAELAHTPGEWRRGHIFDSAETIEFSLGSNHPTSSAGEPKPCVSRLCPLLFDLDIR